MSDRNFQILLGKYFDGGWLNISDGLISFFAHNFVLRKNAKKLIAAFNNKVELKEVAPAHSIVIPQYLGQDERIAQMIRLLETIQEDIVLALVHGSIATDEIIRYSDFDGLLIIRNEVFTDEKRLSRMAKVVHSSRLIMHEIDPLQHHGWFVMTEEDLKNYPEDYLPVEILNYSKSLWPVADVVMEVSSGSKADYFSPIKKICRRIRKNAQQRNRPRTLYQLKSILSEFMMLPTLYIQARDQRGIFKKFSFTAAAADFNQGVWSIMDEVSSIRSEWPEFESKNELKKFRKIGYIWMKYRKKKGPGIPASLSGKLNDDFYQRMAALANQVEINLFR